MRLKRGLSFLILLLALRWSGIAIAYQEQQEQKDTGWLRDFTTRQSWYLLSRYLVVAKHLETPEVIKVVDPEVISGCLSGVISLDGHLKPFPVVLEVRYSGQTAPIRTYQIMPNINGAYKLPGVPTSTYDITARVSNSLRSKIKNVLIKPSKTTANINFNLVFGDADGNNVINAFDYSILNAAFGSKPSDKNWNGRTDFDGNGFINAFDNSILNSNFGKRGED